MAHIASPAPVPTIPGFRVTPNGHDVRVECTTCHASKAGSLARTWAGVHGATHHRAEWDALVDADPERAEWDALVR